MFRSVFLRRIILIVMIALLFSAIFSSGLFLLASASYSREDILQKTLEKAEVLSISLNTDSEQIHSESDVNEFILEYDLFGSYVLIYDAEGHLLVQTNELTEYDTRVLIPTKLHSEANWLNKSDYVYVHDFLPFGQMLDQIIIVQTPLYVNGELTAYIIVATPTEDMSRLLSDFLNILLLSTFFVSLAMLMPVYFATMRLVMPLRKVTTIAQAMGQGDFSIRADSNAKGEIGELAKSFNDLSDRLSKSITDLTVERNRLREIFDVISEGIVLCIISKGVATYTISEGVVICIISKGVATYTISEGVAICVISEGVAICVISEGVVLCIISKGVLTCIISKGVTTYSISKGVVNRYNPNTISNTICT